MTDITYVADVWLISDNAIWCQNSSLPVIAPNIAKGVGMILRGIVHSEAQSGKRLVDAHFAVAVWHVKKFVNDTIISVSSRSDIVWALNHRDGVDNTTV